MGLVERWPSAAAGRPRRMTRSTWRSIGISGSPKQNSSSTDAVFLPIPSICVSQVARLERRHVAEELERVVAAFLADRAQGRLEPWRLLVGQAARPDHVGQLGESARTRPRPSPAATPSGSPTPPQPAPGLVGLGRPAARIGLRAAPRTRPRRSMSALFWVRIVRISSLVGSSRRSQVGRPYRVGQRVEHERRQPGPVALEPLGVARGRVGELALLRALGLAFGWLGGRRRGSIVPSGSTPDAETSRASRSPQRSSGAVPAAIAASTDCGRSTTGTATAPTAASASMPVGLHAAADRDAGARPPPAPVARRRARSCRTRSGRRSGPRR